MEDEATWTADWPKRVLSRLRIQGFETVRDFLKRYPAKPYTHLVKMIAPWVAAMQLTRLQMEEALREGRLRDAAMDSLTRNLNELPDGWVPDGETESRAAAAAAHSTTLIVIDGRSPKLRSTMLEVYRVLKGMRPPIGWRPAGPDDPLIVEAFEQAWPRSRCEEPQDE